MTILNDVSLQPFNTFGIDVNSRAFCNITSVEDLRAVLTTHSNQPLFILGGGSNMLLTKAIDALVLHINIKGIEVIEETDTHVCVEAMAGENWHDFVLWCISQDYGGIENLSLIPGNMGSAPIQNIGAYGVELKDVFVNCEALNIRDLSLRTFSRTDCKFGYRESVFKQDLKGDYIITSVTLRLTKTNHRLHLDYGAIKTELNSRGIDHPSIKEVSEVVIGIRQSKLPDPKHIGNSGSFFKNPIISLDQYTKLKSNFPAMPSYPISPKEVKIPAGWLIEKAGFKGKRFGNYGIHKNQALVLVNYGGADGKAIKKLATLIQQTIKRIFDIHIETEVNIF